MDIVKKKGIIIFGVILGLLLLILLVVYLITSLNPGAPESDNPKGKDTEIVYPEIKDDPRTILAKVYNPRYNYYNDFYSDTNEKQNLFGNTSEFAVSNLGTIAKMTIALNAIDYKQMQTITCNKVQFNDRNFVCGSKNTKLAYALKVQDLNDKIYDIFGYDIDYTNLDTESLVIGSCVGKNSYYFKFLEKSGLFVSTYNKNCLTRGSIDIINVTKSQEKDLLTLDVYYYKKGINPKTNRVYSNIKNHDRFFFKIKENGKYYFYSTTMIEKNIK